MLTIEQVDPQSQAQVDRFVELPYRLFAICPQWVPPLLENARLVLDHEKHPLYEYSEAGFFIAVRDGRDVGRIAVHAPRYEGPTTAKFYLFDCENDDDAATALFEQIFEWARQRGFKKISGPRGFTMLDGDGILVKGFEHAPVIETMTYNYDYYRALIEAIGFEKEGETGSYTTRTDRQVPVLLHQMADQVRQRGGLHIKSFSTMAELLNWTPRLLETLKKAFHYRLIITREDAFVVDFFKHRANPRFMKAIMYGEEMVGVSIAIPNISATLQRTRGHIKRDQLQQEIKRTKRITIFGIGVLPDFQSQGINVILFSEIEKMVRETGIKRLDIPSVSEENLRMKNDLRALGLEPYQAHRLYIRDLA